jgi:hypothetical protein
MHKRARTVSKYLLLHFFLDNMKKFFSFVFSLFSRIQDVCLIFSLIIIFLSFFSTYVFQVTASFLGLEKSLKTSHIDGFMTCTPSLMLALC